MNPILKKFSWGKMTDLGADEKAPKSIQEIKAEIDLKLMKYG